MQKKKLLDTKSISQTYGLGRDLSRNLIMRLPHVLSGSRGEGVKRLVREETFDLLIVKAEQENADLWLLVKKFHPTALCRWLDLPVPARLLEESQDDPRPLLGD